LQAGGKELRLPNVLQANQEHVLDTTPVSGQVFPAHEGRRNPHRPGRIQAMYSIQHEALGADPHAIFIVPVGKVEGGFEYEAVFT
jgi:Domain of unknown function (DUF6916)